MRQHQWRKSHIQSEQIFSITSSCSKQLWSTPCQTRLIDLSAQYLMTQNYSLILITPSLVLKGRCLPQTSVATYFKVKIYFLTCNLLLFTISIGPNNRKSSLYASVFFSPYYPVIVTQFPHISSSISPRLSLNT